MAIMEYLMGIKGKDFVIVAGDTSATQQIITIKHDEDKLVPIDSHKLMCLSGAITGTVLDRPCPTRNMLNWLVDSLIEVINVFLT